MPDHIRLPLARLSPAKDGFVLVEFGRRRIKIGNIAEILKTLSPMLVAPMLPSQPILGGKQAFL